MAAAGIGGLLLTSETVGPNKIHRLMRLCTEHPDTMAVVDHAGNAEQLDEAARAAGVQLDVLLDVDPLGRRTGIPPGPGAVALAERIDRLVNLRLRGVHGYCGASSHVKGFEERKEHSERYMEPVLESYFAMRKKGLPVEIMSGASTGTYNIDSVLEGITELQVGSYALMDVDYRIIGGRGGEVYDDFQCALHVLATVISKEPRRRRDRRCRPEGLRDGPQFWPRCCASSRPSLRVPRRRARRSEASRRRTFGGSRRQDRTRRTALRSQRQPVRPDVLHARRARPAGLENRRARASLSQR